ncbi:ATP synthase F1, delta subunit [Geobacter metallireducens RCH3]|uniref:ATP synthase subunit delta n=1 Tax=Geobacter metallireducens (strain ATCC 53774 / DSM 7210 / GS-15) TaxID=269799 RepID=ATPD_GEOMG|nr:ATP synthase F1 subunit delta [Geobacter metallireducens]Q39Q53.1 RecName: Full=ATP synthase subunit delta; AltName: Full=ATP synthase F(1) sector subunit delta; AltName: Full=F-type ATPase subunit delta; Short=F-ATPase subunit delta [Geobacter metallireducens GS-15]ABB33621.1 ATP synthase F1, delta subunit [Geobacter metallireducens GS-15]EHP84841.1 ATP synthase F1, delta subunit [Geobacter metallireducens RCH3]
MISNAIARRYAKALVQLGAEEDAVDRFGAELGQFAALLEGNADIDSVLKSPAYRIEAKREILKDVLAKLSLSGTVSNFLQVLLDRGRISFLPQIAHSYAAFADELSGVIRPVLTSAFPLEDAQVESMKGALVKATGKKVQLSVQVEPSLIGGVITKIGDKVFDGSVRTQLNRIQDILQKG